MRGEGEEALDLVPILHGVYVYVEIIGMVTKMGGMDQCGAIMFYVWGIYLESIFYVPSLTFCKN